MQPAGTRDDSDPAARGGRAAARAYRGSAAGTGRVPPRNFGGGFSPRSPSLDFLVAKEGRGQEGGALRRGEPHVCGRSPARLGRRPRRCRGLPRLRARGAAGWPRVTLTPSGAAAPPRGAMEPGAAPDLRDVEQKLGRKVPESLARPLRGEEHPGRAAAAAEPTRGPAAAPGRRRAAALARLETKLRLLRQEMVSSRAPRELRRGSRSATHGGAPRPRSPGPARSARGAPPYCGRERQERLRGAPGPDLAVARCGRGTAGRPPACEAAELAGPRARGSAGFLQSDSWMGRCHLPFC